MYRSNRKLDKESGNVNELMTIQNVRGRLRPDGTAELNLRDIARGLGFTQVKNGVEYIRWETVIRYLKEFGFSQQAGKDELPEFVAENVFYKLCFKAENQVARQFQDVVTDEVLPSIRKHGAYITPQKIEDILLNPDTLIQLATQLKQEREARLHLESKLEADKPKVLFAEALETSNSSILIGELAKLLRQNGIDVGQNRLFDILRNEGYLMRTLGERWNDPTQRSMDLGILEIKKRSINNPDGSVRVTKTTKVTVKGQIYFINKFKSLVDAQSEIAATNY